MSSSNRAWMPLYITDYLAKTSHLTGAEHGAYMLLIMHYWQNGSLPENEKLIARIGRMDADQWSESRDVLADLFDANWTHSRIDEELLKADDIIEKRRNAASRRHKQCKSNASAEQVDSNSSDTGALPRTYNISTNVDKDISVKQDLESEFENQFWPVYPRKVSKGAALKAFKAARKKTDLGTILSGVFLFAKARRGEDANFTKHAASWLNAECWKDEPDPPPRSGSSRPNGRPLNAADAMREKWRNDAENGSRDSRDVELLSSDQSGSAAFDWLDYKALPGPIRSGDH